MATRTTLKTYFETGDTPTQAQFGSLVDSDFNKTDDDSDDITEGSTNLLMTSSERSAIVANTGKNSYPSADSSKLAGIEAGAEANDADTTLQGNTFNGNSQLVQTDGLGKLPAIDGSQLTGLSGVGESNTSSNGGTGGVGIVLTKAGVNLPFKSINAGSAKVTVTDDAVNKNVDIDIVESEISLDNIADGTTYKKVSAAEKTVLGNTSGTNTGDESDANLTTKGIVELATATETTTGTDATRAVSPDGLSGSIFGKVEIGISLFDSDSAVTTGNGVIGIPITSKLNGFNIIGAQANVYTKGVTGTTDIVIRKQRGATDSDVTSTAITIGDEYYATDCVVDTVADDLATGDMLFIDVDAVHSGTAPNGLSVIITCQLP